MFLSRQKCSDFDRVRTRGPTPVEGARALPLCYLAIRQRLHKLYQQLHVLLTHLLVT